MKGREQNDIKRERKIRIKLRMLPPFVSEWNNAMLASELSSSTRLDYIDKISRYFYFLNGNPVSTKVEEFTKLKTDRYLASITNIICADGSIRKSSDSYKQTVWSCLNNFFDFLVEYGYMVNNPINMKKKPRNNDLQRINENRVLLTKDDFKAIKATIEEGGAGTRKAKTRQQKWKNRDMSILLLLMSTGMRETALSEIDIDDVDLDDSTIIITDKGNKFHRYDLNSTTKEAISKWLIDREECFGNPETRALFLNYQGNRISAKDGISKIVRKYTKEALGRELSPHKLRAGFCSIMYDETHDIEKVRRMVGHSNITTTQRYIVTSNAERKEAAKIIDSFF